MKALEFLETHIAFLQKQSADRMPVADIRRRVRISQTTYFNWKKK